MEQCNPCQTPMPTNEVLKLKNDEETVDASTYRSIVGSLMYLTNTRPNISNAVNIVAQFMHKPTRSHLSAVNRILRYLKGTTDLGLLYKHDDSSELHGYADSDWGSNLDDRKSTSGYIFMLGSKSIAWGVRKQPSVALSTTEAKYMALSSAGCECIWLRQILSEIKGKEEDAPTSILCDNTSAIFIAKNPITQRRSKHIDLRFHFIWDQIEKGVIDVTHCASEVQLANILTKALHRVRFADRAARSSQHLPPCSALLTAPASVHSHCLRTARSSQQLPPYSALVTATASMQHAPYNNNPHANSP
ncbi:hypothetical protein KSP39_PZI003779 [Platanthera zijinensis]|uniref:Uncharacterized protein n=1 Tax=Platanthera zijinensis TaxID=2320716 RepID=A0AAP0GCY1_9ASPA